MPWRNLAGAASVATPLGGQGQLVLGFRLVGLGEGGRGLRLDTGDYDALFIKNVSQR
jgi:hypothetical protein